MVEHLFRMSKGLGYMPGVGSRVEVLVTMGPSEKYSYRTLPSGVNDIIPHVFV